MNGRGSRSPGLRLGRRLWRCLGAAAVGLGLTACGPILCRHAAVDITWHPTRPRPASRIVAMCDDVTKLVIDANEVAPP